MLSTELPPFLTPTEAAIYLRISKNTMLSWLKQGKIPFHKASSRTFLIDRNDLPPYNKEHLVVPEVK